ncbi:MAG: lysylphosphatidylglycerol synthase transmembrane domain-containing protein [Anaerolineales bacterium]
MSAASHPKLGAISRWLPGLIISTIAVLLLIRFSNWSEILQAISQINLAWLFPAILFFIASVGLRAWAWMILLQKKVNYGRVYLTLNEGYLLNNIFPFRLGELGRAFILSKTTKLSAFFVLSTIVIERTYDLAIAAGLLLATLPYVFAIERGQSIAVAVLVIVILGLFGMFALARNRHWIKSKLDDFSLQKFVIRDRIVPRIDSFLSGLGVLAKWDQFLLSVLLMVLGWIFGGLELIFLSQSFGVDLEIWMVGFILGMISLGIAIPSAPAGLGVFEVAAVGAFSLLGLSTSAGLAIAFVSHFISITFTGLVGMYGIFQDGENFAGLYRRLINLRMT